MLLSVFVAGAVGALGESWGDVQKAAGAMERIDELMRATPGIAAPAQPRALPEPPRGEVSMSAIDFAYPGRPDLAVAGADRTGDAVGAERLRWDPLE